MTLSCAIKANFRKIIQRSVISVILSNINHNIRICWFLNFQWFTELQSCLINNKKTYKREFWKRILKVLYIKQRKEGISKLQQISNFKYMCLK